MAPRVTHAKVSGKPACIDNTLIDGPAWDDQHVLTTTITVKTTAGPFTITNEQVYVLKKASPSATTINLPTVAAYGDGKDLEIFDWNGTAGDITINAAAGETVNGLSSWTVGSAGVPGGGGSLKLRASTSLAGWLAR